MNSDGRPARARLRDWLELARAPTWLTAPGDPLAGALLAAGFRLRVGAVLAASTLIYAGGMALNDALDAGEDRRERPERPIPSGRISAKHARAAAVALLLLGVAFAFVGGARAGGVGIALAGAAAAYDAGLRRGGAGPWVMGACRGLNVVLGAAASGAVLENAGPALWAAAGIALYTAAVTALARAETAERRLAVRPWAPFAAAGLAATAVGVFGSDAMGRRVGAAAALWAVARALPPAQGWNAASVERRRKWIGSLVGAMPLLQAAFIAAAGGAAVAVGAAWALLAPLQRRIARGFSAS